MARKQWCGLVSAVALTTIVAPSVAFGQGIRYGAGGTGQQQQQQQQQAKQELHGKGELEAISGGKIKAVLDGQPWVIIAEPKAKLTVRGSATADALAMGLYVKFKGQFDKKGKDIDEVKDLEIFTPSEKDPLGATQTGGAFETSGPKKGPSALPTSYDIAGRITAIKKVTITVACGNMTVHADVAADATVTVNIADMSVASPGDKIEVRGWYYKGQEGGGYASEIQVELANTLTGPKKKGAHPAKAAEKSTDAADPISPDAKKPAKPTPNKGTDPKPAATRPGDDKKQDDTKTSDKDKADPLP